MCDYDLTRFMQAHRGSCLDFVWAGLIRASVVCPQIGTEAQNGKTAVDPL